MKTQTRLAQKKSVGSQNSTSIVDGMLLNL